MFPFPWLTQKDPDTVYVASVVAWKSSDAGKTWYGLRGAPGDDDYQNVFVNPNNTKIIALASDQRVIISQNGGEIWTLWFNQAGPHYRGRDSRSGSARLPRRAQHRTSRLTLDIHVNSAGDALRSLAQLAMRGSGGVPLHDVEEEWRRLVDLVAHVTNQDGWSLRTAVVGHWANCTPN
jgi:hypothetical protein